MDEGALIDAIERREWLWNHSHPHHRNVVILRKTWKSIEKELNYPEKLIRTRWKNLRAYFGKEVQKLIARGVDPDDITNSNWRFYKRLQFTRQNGERDLNNVEVLLEDDDEPPSQMNPLSPEPDGTDSIDTSTNKMDQLLDIGIQMLQKDTESNYNDDLLFFKSLLPYMAAIQPIPKLNLRSKIQNLILEELKLL